MKLKNSEKKRQKRKLEYSKSDAVVRRARPRLRMVSSSTSMGYASDNEDSSVFLLTPDGKVINLIRGKLFYLFIIACPMIQLLIVWLS